MVIRIRRDWTAPARADAYERLSREELAGIAERRTDGCRGIPLLRRDADNEGEFVTIMRFENRAAASAFAGDDHEAAVVPPQARGFLARFEAGSQ